MTAENAVRAYPDGTSFQGRRSTDGARHDGGMAMVLAEIRDLMGSQGVMLTQHPEGAAAPTILHVDAASRSTPREAALFATATTIRTLSSDPGPFWRARAGDDDMAVLMIPVERIEGHSRLVISLLFERSSDEVRARAERLHRERRPLATGFFQLWQVNRALHKHANALETVLDQTDLGVLLIDRASHVVFANRTGRDFLEDGGGIRLANGAIRASSVADSVNLQAALSCVMDVDPAAGRRAAAQVPVLSFRRDGAPPLIASVLPAPDPAIGPRDPAAIVYVVDPRLQSAEALAPFCRLYGLSPVETTLACHLVVGEPVATAARKMHIKEQTARSYLKQIFIKTATRRQTELVVLILSGLIRMRRSILPQALTTLASERALTRFRNA